jgi:purine nucleosidase
VGTPVFFDHDGGLDDFLSLLMLVSYDDIDLLGISITPADTLPEAAVPATRKILDLGGRSDVPVAAGTVEGTHPFPLAWRVDAYKVNDLPVLNQHEGEPRAPLADLPGQELMARTLLAAKKPVTVLMTSPLTNLAWTLSNHPEAEDRIAGLVLMGGALDVEGNVQEEGHDGSAEWNIYWDPAAAKRVWDSSIPITLFPLDATNQVPVTPEFRTAFGRQYGAPLSDAAGSIWAMTSAWEIAVGMGNPYFCWDTLTTSSLGPADLCTYREVRCDVIVEGPSAGRTVVTENGRPVRAAHRVDVEAFYAHVLESLRR